MLHISEPHHSSKAPFDPTTGASQFGFREISGSLPSDSERITLVAWALVFPDNQLAHDRYAHIVYLLDEVGGDALIRQPIDGIQGETFGNMSERTGLIGDFATLWVSAMAGNDEARGAVLASVGENLVTLVATDLYVAQGDERPTHLLTHLAERMAARERDLALPPASDTMSRLPILIDVFGLLENSRIDVNRYSSSRGH